MPKLIHVTKKYLGSKFKKGGQTPQEGFDCLSLAAHIQKDMGRFDPWALEVDGFTLKNYLELYETLTIEQTNEWIMKIIHKYFDPISEGNAFVGDIAIFNDSQRISFGTVLGNAQILIINSEQGVTPYPMKALKLNYTITYYRYKGER